MILPTTYEVALILAIVSMICWGSWANTFKLTRNWRFELFYFDYALGVLAAALIAAYTFGSMGENLSFADNLMISGKRQMAYAIAAGGIFNLANMLLVAAISIAGLAVAFPIGIGLALVIGVVWNYILKPAGHPAFLFGGAALVIVAVVVDAIAFRRHAAESGQEAQGVTIKGVLLSLVSGLLMGSFYPLVQMSTESEIGLGPYAVAVLFAVGVVLSTPVFNLYFMNLPVKGEAVSPAAYLQGSKSDHLLGLLGGAVWCAGAITNFVAAAAPADVAVGPAVSYALGQGATMISALWGLLVWKEFRGASGGVKTLLAVMMAAFVVGLALVSIAPLMD